MTRERGFPYRRRATGGGGRFKDRPVLVAFGLLALVLIVFGAGMAVASLRGDNGRLDWWRESRNSMRAEHQYNPRGW